MNWVRGAELPGEMKQTTWYPLPEPRNVYEFCSHWKLWADGRDYSGNDGGCNQDGHAGGITIGNGGGPGTLPKSTYFPGGNNCFRSGSGSATQITSPMTGAHWVYPTSTQNSGLLNHLHNSTNIPFYSLLGTHTTAGVWVVGSYSIASGHTWMSSGYTPPLNTWTWLCWTVDPSYVMRTYANGSLTASAGMAFVPLSSQQDVNIGARWDNVGYVGYMSDVRLYNKALSQAEITEIYQRTMGTATPIWVPIG